ncbi:hypothetical protein Taro_032758 [Colocasia esculenta]|uniref:C2H2-type domain-containing protein n=1 Tax=Colocasia esculenta TaxID=4460 RepID=A0A843W713_COLES|nr:hypothetical protein [Colocasia esculenta]
MSSITLSRSSCALSPPQLDARVKPDRTALQSALASTNSTGSAISLPSSSAAHQPVPLAVFCPIAGCGAQLKTLNDFEDHYHARHTASCSVCTRVFPTSRLLSMHVSEAHDSFFQAKVARGFPMYECLVEGCGVKLKSYESRQQHLVDKHKFPTTFEFFKKAHPSKKQRQKYQNKQTAHQRLDSKNMAMDVEGQASGEQQYQKYQVKRTGQSRGETKERHMEVEEKMDDLVSAVSRLSTSDSTPSTISFGRRHARGIQFLPRSIQRSKKSVSSADGKG